MNFNASNEETVDALLREHDDPERWEYPLDFDYNSAQSRFNQFLELLELELNQKFPSDTGARIQDASFHSQILLPGGLLRFSNFGDMLGLSPGHEVPSPILEAIAAVAQLLEYHLIPAELLERQYPGRDVTGIKDWWTRYFAWL